jgi:hypothetical protein
MRHLTSILLSRLLLVCGEAFCAQDCFNGVRCGAEIPKALRGGLMPDETVVTIENRHQDLGLADCPPRGFCAHELGSSLSMAEPSLRRRRLWHPAHLTATLRKVSVSLRPKRPWSACTTSITFVIVSGTASK